MVLFFRLAIISGSYDNSFRDMKTGDVKIESSGGGGLRLSCVGCLVDEEVSVIGFHYGCVLSFFSAVFFYFLTV